MDLFEPNYSLTDSDKTKISMIREAFKKCGFAVEATIPEGRYKEQSLMDLEQSCMWAIKSITHDSILEGLKK